MEIDRAKGTVSFTYHDNQAGGDEKVLTLSRVEFIGRFLWHVLPQRYVRIRSAPQTPDRPDPREAQGVCTGEKRGRKVHNRPGSFNNALKRTASHKLVIERVSTGDCRGLRSRV